MQKPAKKVDIPTELDAPISTLPDDLVFLQSLSERELCELVIIPLLSIQGYGEIRYTHGKLEGGKDIVFTSTDPLAGKLLLCATVKRAPLTGAVTGSRAIREVYYQVRQALTHAYLNPFDGTASMPKRVYIITPHEISNEAVESIKGELQALGNHVFFIDGPLLLTMIRRDIPDLLESLANSELRYLHQLAGRTDELSQVVTPAGRPKLSLRDLYTGGRLTITTKGKARLGSLFLPLDSEIDELQLHDILRDHKYLAIISDAGAGKTTCLKRLTLDLIGMKRLNRSGDSLIPLFVPLHRFSPSTLTEADTFIGELKIFLESEFHFEDFDTAQTLGYSLLLDGFDEVPAHHDQIGKMLSQLPAVFGSVIITSRPSRVPDLGSEFTFVSLAPFSDHDIRNFLLKWCGGETIVADAIWKHIQSDHSLHTFCRNPMLLSMYTALAGRRSVDSLPTRRTEIYAHVTSLLLDDWDRMRGIISTFDSDEKRYALEAISFVLHSLRQKTFTELDFEKCVSEFLAQRKKAGKANDLLDELVYRSSLIRRDLVKGVESAEFIHLSFQEFFAAQWAQRTLSKKEVQPLLFDEWWRNCVRFYSGLTRTLDGLLPRTKAIFPGKALWLAEYLSEADFTSGETKAAILEFVETDLARSKNIEHNEIEYAARAGDELMQRMEQRFQRGGLPTFYNYLRLLMFYDSDLCRKLGKRLLNESDTKTAMTASECAECLVIACQKLSHPVWYEWSQNLMGRIEESTAATMIQLFEGGQLQGRGAKRIIPRLQRQLDEVMPQLDELVDFFERPAVSRQERQLTYEAVNILAAAKDLRENLLRRFTGLVAKSH